jgi:hypothetical protein
LSLEERACRVARLRTPRSADNRKDNLNAHHFEGYRLCWLFALAGFRSGTPEQREACEGDADRVCEAYIPDAVAIERCLRANAGSISAACKAELGLASAGGKRRKR